MYFLRKIWRPEIFQGGGRGKKYFEGWYFKLVSADKQHAYAFIPGVSIESPGTAHAFIQIINGTTNNSEYFSFPFREFSYSPRHFKIRIGNNRFTSTEMVVELSTGRYPVRANLRFHDPVPFRGSPLSPGIMGWYSFVPFMECYHGMVSLDHRIEGQAEIDGTPLDFTGGRGYIEKDWGFSFPSSWIWMQSNHFSREGTSFTFSIARIPWLRRYFIGHIGLLWYRQEPFLFTTYNGSEIIHLHLRDDGADVVIRHEKLSLELQARKKSSGVLQAPVLGKMERRITESIDSTLAILLRDRHGNILLEDTGERAGFEMAGPVGELMKVLSRNKK